MRWVAVATRWMGVVPPVVVLGLLGPPFVFEARLSMPLRGIPEGVPFPLPTVLLLVGFGVALVLAAGVARARSAWSAVGLAVCAVPLGLALPGALGPSAPGLRAQIEQVGAAGTMQLWALLTVAGLVASLAAALAARRVLEWRNRPDRDRLRVVRGALAALLAAGFIVMILRTSTGVDFLSSWTRWGAIGVAMAASIVAGLIPEEPDQDTEPTVHALLFACVAVSLLAQREYVAALAANALVDVGPFLDPAPFEHSLREIAFAVEPRERYGWALGLLPFVVLGRWVRAPRRAALPLGMALALLGFALGMSHHLDRRAAVSMTSEPSGPVHDAALIEWSRRAIPRSVPWLRAMRAAGSEVRCAAWSTPPQRGVDHDGG